MEADANATILATSRIRLSIANEEVWQVPSLDYRVANGTDHASAEINPFHEKKCDSVLLFLDRALEATPDFRTSLDELREINSICQYLEGIPLAIEIAASASRLLTIPQIAARMSKIDQLPVPDHLRVSHKQVPLRSIVDWSINLIGEPGSILLARLSIFAGPFTLSAAEEICHDDRLKKEEVLACIGLLLDHSLLSVDRSQKNPQFSMHEVIRQAAFVLLKASDDVASYQSKHISYYTSLAEQIEPLLQGPDQGEWLEKLDREFSNIRKAISVSIDLKLVSDALTLGSSLFWYWIKRRQIHQGLSVLERLVTIPDAELHLPIFTKTLRMIGVLHWNDGNYFSARSNLEKVLELTQADMILQHERAHALAWFGVTQMRLGDYAKARHLEMESLGIFRKLNDQWGTAFASYCLGRILLEIHDLNPAYSATIKACEEFRSIGDPWGLALALSSLGLIYIQNQEYYLAKTTYQESLTVRESLGDQWGVNASLVSLGDLCRLEDDLDHAEKYYQRSLNLLKPFGDSCVLA
ncbi:MAG: tetratricopeptide repeat protein, partial [Anaerolineaceae bacterium]|nr:tetratricopeptide repeat protein [Anaerolineaceae bacterium]